MPESLKVPKSDFDAALKRLLSTPAIKRDDIKPVKPRKARPSKSDR